MKLYLYFFGIIILFLSFGCNQKEVSVDSKKMNDLLDKYQMITDSLLFSIWDYSDLQIDEIASAGFNENEIRFAINNILNRFSQIHEVVYVNSNGMLKYAVPTGYRFSEGTDISKQAHVLKLFETKQRVFSNIFKLVEGYYANIMEAPIVKDGNCIGSISSLFKPDVLISSIIENTEKDGIDEFFILESTGTLVYDTDLSQIGKNVLTDTLYSSDEQLFMLTNTIIKENSGEKDYFFLDKEKKHKIKKRVWWQTSNYYGNEWKFCISKNLE